MMRKYNQVLGSLQNIKKCYLYSRKTQQTSDTAGHKGTMRRSSGDMYCAIGALTARCEGATGLTVRKSLESAPGGTITL